MKKHISFLLHSSPIVTLTLILFIAAASFVVVGFVNRIEEQRALDSLYSEAEVLGRNITLQIGRDREQLEVFASIAAGFDDPRDPALWNILSSFSISGMIGRLALLLPDNTVVDGSGVERQSEEKIRFDEVAPKGAHITGRQRSIDDGNYVLRHYVPVIRDGQTVAMLYGLVDLESLPDDLIISTYEGQASVYIIDASNGDFLLDTWHKNVGLGNFIDMEGRTMAPGYDHETSMAAVLSGETGHVVFLSRSTGDYLYFHYRDIGINEWRLALSVPEPIVFSYAHQVGNMLNILLAAETVCFSLYFLWVFISVRKQTGEKQRQVDALNNVYGISELLFEAHEKQENISPALQRVGQITGSRAARLWVARSGDEGLVFSWMEDEDGKRSGRIDYIGYLKEYFLSGEKYFESRGSYKLRGILHSTSSKELAGLCAIALEDGEGAFCGFLAVENPKAVKSVQSLLVSVSPSFSMLCRNLKGYSRIRVRGEIDSLTGLLNRNRYERDLSSWQSWYRKSLACVYIDANGLHELNNTRGHAAGDEMLRGAAAAIMRAFGKKHSYRIGGDEFIAFIADRTEAEALALCKELEASLHSRGIQVAIGMYYSVEPEELAPLVREAEKRMYSAKQSFYESKDYQR